MGTHRWLIILITLSMLTLINACGTHPQTPDLLASDIRPTAAPALAVTSTAATAAHTSSTAGAPDAQSPTAREGALGAQLPLPFYGIQYVPLDELPHVRELGFEVVLNNFDYDVDPSIWVAYLDTAHALQMRVIPWLWPEAWTLDRETGTWIIDATARQFLETVARHPATLAVYGLHEPYWMECDTCGYTTAEQQALYTAIKQIVPVPIYSEINGFTFWAEVNREKTIAPGVCDYCMTGFYPFLDDGSYQRDELIALIEREIATLQRYAPESRLIWTMPAFAYQEDSLRMPTSEEMWDYANLVYGRPEISGAWWYMWYWDNELYQSFLAEHPENHPMLRKIYDEIVVPRQKKADGFVPQLPPIVSFQVQYTGKIDSSIDVDVFNLDLFDTPPAIIRELRERGIFVMCYLSAGSYEDWRPDVYKFPSEVLGNDMAGWRGEQWLDIRRLDILGPIMEARFDLAVEKGCDGVDPDNVNGYENDTGFLLTDQDQLVYNRFLSTAAHRRGLAIGLKNDIEQAADLVSDFEWILNESCFSYEECHLLQPFKEAGKPVFVIEYDREPEEICTQASQLSFNALIKHRELDAYRIDCHQFSTGS